jgi:hypothetical protein
LVLGIGTVARASSSGNPPVPDRRDAQSPGAPIRLPEKQEALPSGATVEAPTSDPEAWSGRDFWDWAQSLRGRGGFVPEKVARNLSSWWSTCLMSEGVTPDAMVQGFKRFGQTKHWESADPPYPFVAFMSDWQKYVRKAVAHAAAV